jgi:NADH-quinone oxidoreductase subunit M
VSFPILSAIVFVPIAGAVVALALPRQAAWVWALVVAALDLALSIGLGVAFQASSGALQFAESQPWIPGLGLDYRLGVDGISLFLVILTALLALVTLGASTAQARDATRRGGTFFALMLLLVGGMQGVFLATNAFLFYVFWEIMLVPAYLLIGTFGGPNRARAAITFVIYTAVGSLLMLAGIIGLGAAASASTGGFTLNLPELIGHVPVGSQMILFLAFFAAFAVKVPLVPFHSWLPDAYVEAPTPVTVLLAGAMSKTGAYGFIRWCLPLFPQATRDLTPLLETLAVIGILYCALIALVQTDFKRLLAYSSISHLGVVILGVFALNLQGIEGGVLQMVNHGITTGALFLIAGFIEQRTGTRSISDLGGLASRVPLLATVFAIAALSSLGLPGLNSFAGEFLALLGAFRANVVFGTLGTLVVVPAAWYLLRFFQGTMQGPLKDNAATARARDLNVWQLVVLAPLLALMVVIGFVPAPLPDRIGPAASATLAAVASPSAAHHQAPPVVHSAHHP